MPQPQSEVNEQGWDEFAGFVFLCCEHEKKKKGCIIYDVCVYNIIRIYLLYIMIYNNYQV